MILRTWHGHLAVGERTGIELRIPTRTLDPAALARDVLTGAGFDGERLERAGRRLRAMVIRQRTLADTVGPGMQLLICGLNPSVYSADAGTAFARPGNRFWPALHEAIPAVPDKDPATLLGEHRIGLTDLVKRASVAAHELTAGEYVEGTGRVERLCHWLAPAAVAFVGLTGWRVAVDRKAAVGWQPGPLGATPVYLMPSTSGRNAHALPAQLADHFRAALAPP